MKTIIVLLVSLLVVLSSCENQDDVVINTESIKSELAALPSPEKQEFTDVINSNYSTSKLKSASTQISLVEVFALNEETFEVYDDYAVKKFVYYEISNQGERVELLTMLQQFQIVNGKLDTSGYSIEYKIGCNDSREFSIDNDAEIWNVICMFHFENGSQLAYYFEGDSERIKLPNIANGNWEVAVTTFDGDLIRELTTGYIDFENEPEELCLVVQPKDVNVAAKCSVNKEILKDIYYIKFIGEDLETGEDIWFYVPFRYNENLQGILVFNLPFYPKWVILVSEYSEKWSWIQDNWTQTPGQLPNYFININN